MQYLPKLSSLVAISLFASLTFNAQAAIVNVSSLSVDTVSASVTAIEPITGTTQLNTGTSISLIPPADIQMGSFQSSIFEFTSTFTDGSFVGTVYSAALPGVNAPSASVDTQMGTFDSVDLSSLRLSGIVTLNAPSLGSNLSFDTELWPITTMPDTSTYNALTGDFSLGWSLSDLINFDTTFSTLTLDTTVDFTISGNASVVPVPAAFWLFASGILGIAGLLKRK